MTINQLSEKLNNEFQKCFLIIDKELNPNEAIIVTHQKDCFLSLIKGEKGISFVFPEKRAMLLRVYSFSEIGLKKIDSVWEKNCLSKLGNLVEVGCYDIEMFFLWRAFACTEKESWLSRNTLDVIKRRWNCEALDELLLKLREYLLDNGARISFHYIIDIPKIMCSLLPIPYLCFYRSAILLKKVRRKMILWCLSIMGVSHRLFSQKKYYLYLLSSGVLGDEYYRLNNKNGSSSSTFYRIKRYEDSTFLKGNELYVYNSIHNEIGAQQKLQFLYPNDEWYLRMLRADNNGAWVEYPFVDSVALDEYIKDHVLTNEQIYQLGDFLCECLDKLFAANIVHNDLRPSNILVFENEVGIECFKLIDFGCASVDGCDPWNNDFWGRYLASTVCGDYRYDESMIDDAASAYLLFQDLCGENCTTFLVKLKERIGRIYYDSTF